MSHMRKTGRLALAALAALALGIGVQADTARAAEVPEMMVIQVLAADGSVAESIEVMFNPTELTIEKSVPWQKHKSSKGDQPKLEWTSADPAVLSVELLFDSYDTGNDVTALVQPIQDLATVDPTTRRPPQLQLVWGSGLGFSCVVEEIHAKYTLFREDGTPTRAQVQLRLVEYPPSD